MLLVAIGRTFEKNTQEEICKNDERVAKISKTIEEQKKELQEKKL